MCSSDLHYMVCSFKTRQHNLYMTHHAQGDSIDTQFNHIRRIYLKFYHYQISLISNAANCDTVILDKSLFTE